MRYLGILVLTALLLGACVTPAAAPVPSPVAAVAVRPDPTSPPTATEPARAIVLVRTPESVGTTVATTLPAAPAPASAYVEPNLYVDSQIPNRVAGVFVFISGQYPGSAKGIRKLITVRYPKIGWAVKFEPGVVYVNLGIRYCANGAAWCVKGKIDHAKALAWQYGRYIYAGWQMRGDRRANAWRTPQAFAGKLAQGAG